MTFSIDFVVTLNETPHGLTELVAPGRELPGGLPPLGEQTGFLAITVDGRAAPSSYEEPLLRLVDQFLRKIPWIVGGDTETVALRNSEHCFAFVPAGQSVELSFYAGDETAIEESLLEATTVPLPAFVGGVLALGERVLALGERVGERPGTGSDDALGDLKLSLEEARRAWRDHQLHQRR